jgi:endonuclease YncB( thermonuclease family)
MMIHRFSAVAFLCLFLVCGATVSAVSETNNGRYYIPGPVEAELVSVVDGDTLMVNARPWPQQTVSVLVRIRGIDTPELHAKCASLRELALAAKDVLKEALSAGDGKLSLTSISGDKYFGRVVADVSFDHGHNAAAIMLAAGLARPYDGGKKAREACG